jgi:Predicted membrane protein (DUF2306)
MSTSFGHVKLWRWPWILFLLSIYLFAIPWIFQSILWRYWIRRQWREILVGLDTTLARKIFMLGHMTFGAIALLIAPIQYIPYIRHNYQYIHRWCGRLYVLMAILCSVFGLIFIVLKRGILVGGINMGLAFTASGITFGYCAIRVYQTASNRNFQSHQEWTIRSYSQVLSPMFYRYWYVLLVVLRWHELDYTACDVSTEMCPMYFQIFDSIHCWTYWLVPLAIAELIIYMLPKPKDSAVMELEHSAGEVIQAEDEEQMNSAIVEDPVVSNYNTIPSLERICTTTNGENKPTSYLGINVVSCILSVIVTSVTILIFSSAFM